MQITDTRVRLHQRGAADDRLLARVSIVIDEVFVVHGLRVIQGSYGPFVAMPRDGADPDRRDIAHPITPEARMYVQETVLVAYRAQCDAQAMTAARS